MVRAFFLALVAMVAVVILGHLVFPVIGLLMAAGIAVWVVILGSIIGFCVLVMVMFLVGGAGVLALSGIAGAWALVAILLFPIVFPIVLPLLILVFFIAYLRKQHKVVRSDQNI